MSDTSKTKSKMPQIGEAVFCIVYLVFGLIAGIIMLTNSADNKTVLLYGIMTLVLACGDSFHLVPRIINAFKNEFKSYTFWAGLGLMISSITMTVFYLLLYGVWESMYGKGGTVVMAVLYVFAIVRIVLCLFPQNKWTTGGDSKWGIIRNVPFAVVGIIMVVLFAIKGRFDMAAAIVISFGCYFPVVLWAKKNPKIGMLMMPKTMAYMWMIIIGLLMIG